MADTFKLQINVIAPKKSEILGDMPPCSGGLKKAKPDPAPSGDGLKPSLTVMLAAIASTTF